MHVWNIIFPSCLQSHPLRALSPLLLLGNLSTHFVSVVFPKWMASSDTPVQLKEAARGNNGHVSRQRCEGHCHNVLHHDRCWKEKSPAYFRSLSRSIHWIVDHLILTVSFIYNIPPLLVRVNSQSSQTLLIQYADISTWAVFIHDIKV